MLTLFSNIEARRVALVANIGIVIEHRVQFHLFLCCSVKWVYLMRKTSSVKESMMLEQTIRVSNIDVFGVKCNKERNKNVLKNL